MMIAPSRPIMAHSLTSIWSTCPVRSFSSHLILPTPPTQTPLLRVHPRPSPVNWFPTPDRVFAPSKNERRWLFHPSHCRQDRSKSQAGRVQESNLFRTLVSWALWIPVGILFVEHGFSVVRISGMSMQPTFNPDSSLLKRDVVLVNHLASSFNRGDIVTFWHPEDPTVLLTKRIVALEGDVVKTREYHSGKFCRIPSGHCWVEGDDHFHSKDSNTYGPIPIGLINAKVMMIIWPLSRFGRIPEYVNKHAQKRVLVSQL